MNLEKMKAGDMDQVTEQLTDAFAEKFTEGSSLSQETVKKLIQLFWLNEADMFGLELYALKEGSEVVGTFGLTKRNKKRLTVSFLGKLFAAVRVLGVRPVMQFALTGLETNRTPDSNECYIDFIAVKESRRNQHLGHRLMEEIIRLKENDLDITKLSLYVLKGNERAEHLYRAYGFEHDKANERSSYNFMVRE